MNFKRKIHLKWTRKKTWILISILASLGILISIYFFFFKNVFLTESIVMRISGLKEVVSGKEITWLLLIKNESEVKIKDLNLVFEYPSGVFDKEGSIKKREIKIIDELSPQKEINEKFSGIIFGVKDEMKEAKASLIYTPSGLSTQFESKTSFSTRISETSIVFLMKIPSKINPNEEFPILISWQSGFPFPLENVQIRLSLPQGFQASESAGGEKEENKMIFNIGSINEGEGGKKEIKGKVEGEVGDQKLFRADFGIFDLKLYEFVPLANIGRTIKIISSTLDVFRKINGDYNFIASPGETLNYIIEFKNTGEDIYRNLNLVIELESNVLDFGTIVAPGGKIEGKKIIFSSKNFPDLLFLGPYGEGEVGFKVSVKEYTSAFHPQNGKILENITFGGIEKTFQTKVSSLISFSQEVYCTKENLPSQIKDFFENTGPCPLQVEQETKLIVLFNIKNLGNRLENAKIETKLGENVEYLEGKVYPTGTKINFEQDTKKLTLQVGNLSYYLPLKIFAFQIKIKPKIFPEIIIGKTKITGEDTWVDKGFEIVVPSLTTDLVQ